MSYSHLFILVLCVVFFPNFYLGSQDTAPNDWHHLPTDGNYKGIGTEEAYKLLEGKTPKTVVVAVIDSGIDSEHEDMDGSMWVNEDEVPDNNIDDDNNGYIDDIHGWNFLGSRDGENIESETLEETRIFAAGADFSGSREVFAEASKAYAESRESYVQNLNLVNELIVNLQLLQKLFPNKVNQNSISKIESDDPDIMDIVKNLEVHFKNDGTLEAYHEHLEAAKQFYSDAVNFYYNADYNSRAIIGDDYSNQTERYYGNNDTDAPDASHGTHVAGIIAAERNNGVGVNGVANNVKIMSLRTVPNGDERDKDVANAIYYAVDNGAKVINMSFGKAYSWNKKIVDKAVRYAARKDVLLIHAAGNNASELDGTNNFPHKKFEKKRFLGRKTPKNWIEVGATTYNFDENFVASFSNFDNYYVDIFAPGYQIYSTTPTNTYSKFNGTSMASPMVAGVAALLRGYFPELSAKDVRKIILESATPIDLEVIRPDNKEKVMFKSLSVTGAILNAETAVKMALEK